MTTMKKLPVVLESLRVATPCSADWGDMTGDERVRFCGKCEKNVYNLSAMTRVDAEALVREKEGRLCVRFYQRADGTVLTADCPVGVRRERLRHRVWAAISGAAASAMLLLGIAGGRARADLTMQNDKKQSGIHHPVMGGPVAVHVPPVPLMGKPTMPKKDPPPPPPVAVQGEPMMIQGDVAAPTK
jgi:hypothetical protein